MSVATGTFGGVAASATREGTDADLVIGGTFVATVQLQTAIPDAVGADVWVSMGQLTAPGVVNVRNAIGRKFRAATTAYTSGTVLYSLGVSRNAMLKEA